MVMSFSRGSASLNQLVQDLISEGAIRSKRIAAVMKSVDRAEFVTNRSNSVAYEDTPLSIEHNVTISAPHMHAYCMEWVEPKLRQGARVLDVGCGSGYLLATFYELTKREDGGAHIIGIEHIEELAEFSRVNLRKSYSA